MWQIRGIHAAVAEYIKLVIAKNT